MIFWVLGNKRSRSIKLPQFREFFLTFPGHLEITRNSLQKKNIYQKFGGGMAPLAPPGYATDYRAVFDSTWKVVPTLVDARQA